MQNLNLRRWFRPHYFYQVQMANQTPADSQILDLREPTIRLNYQACQPFLLPRRRLQTIFDQNWAVTPFRISREPLTRSDQTQDLVARLRQVLMST